MRPTWVDCGRWHGSPAVYGRLILAQAAQLASSINNRGYLSVGN
jgi:hypothetical protein